MAETNWNYIGKPEDGKDCRKFVTLLEGGMKWVGIRAWNHTAMQWQNNGELERATVLAWQDLPEPAKKMWHRGQLV